MGFPFSSTFIRSSVFKRTKFDDFYKIARDYHLAVREVRSKNLERMPVLVSYMESDGLSSDIDNPVYK